jgi:MFS family permease
MHSITGAVRRLLALSILARLPEAMLGIGLLVYTQHLTGSFAAAGLVTAAYGLAAGVGGPLLGRLIDARGSRSVLVASASLQAALLGAIAIAPAHLPVVVPVLLATGIGLSAPPVGACLRAQLPSLLADPSTLGRAYTLETSVLELTWVGGPPLVLALGAMWSPGGALAIAGLVLLSSTIAFAAQPASRARVPVTVPERPPGGSLRSPAMRTLTIALLSLGVLLGADEVAVTSAAKALDGTTASAAPLLALWALGSFCGGLLISRIGGRSGRAGGLALGLAALAAGHLALIPAAGNFGTLAAALLAAGAAIAPTEAAAYAMVDAAAPAGTITEAFCWLYTAIAVGNATGAAAAGYLAEHLGTTSAFALGASTCATAALVTALRARTLAPDPSSPPEPAATSGALPAGAGA